MFRFQLDPPEKPRRGRPPGQRDPRGVILSIRLQERELERIEAVVARLNDLVPRSTILRVALLRGIEVLDQELAQRGDAVGQVLALGAARSPSPAASASPAPPATVEPAYFDQYLGIPPAMTSLVRPTHPLTGPDARRAGECLARDLVKLCRQIRTFTDEKFAPLNAAVESGAMDREILDWIERYFPVVFAAAKHQKQSFLVGFRKFVEGARRAGPATIPEPAAPPAQPTEARAATTAEPGRGAARAARPRPGDAAHLGKPS